MDYSFVNFLALLGSVCLFLYGMKIMSEGLQKSAGKRLRSILAWMTKNRFLAVVTGVGDRIVNNMIMRHRNIHYMKH